jgi:hypothetical protein
MSALTLACHGSGGRRDWDLSPARTAWRGWGLCSAAIEGEFGAAVAAESLADRTIGATRRTASAKRRAAIGTELLAFRVFCIALRAAHLVSRLAGIVENDRMLRTDRRDLGAESGQVFWSLTSAGLGQVPIINSLCRRMRVRVNTTLVSEPGPNRI